MVAAKRFRKFGVRCGLVLLGSLVAIGLSELLLRLAGWSAPVPYIADEFTGSRLQPGWTGWYVKEGRAPVAVNQAGFRDRNHAVPKPPKTLRILVLGDSYVEAVQVSAKETFWSLLEESLGAEVRAKGWNVEVVAMGVSGWGTAQACLAMEHYGFAYSPDIVVLAFFSGNDLRNNSSQFEKEYPRPFFVLRGDELELDDSFRQHPFFVQAQSPWTRFKVGLIDHSRLVQALWEARQRWKAEPLGRQAGAEAGLDDACFLEPTDKAWQETWDVTERLMLAMNDECRARRAKFCVMTVTNPIQVYPDPSVRSKYQRLIGVENLDYSDRRIRAFAESHEFLAVILADRMRAHAESQHEYLHGFANATLGEGHWNVAGHRLAGQILADELRPFLPDHEPSPHAPDKPLAP